MSNFGCGISFHELGPRRRYISDCAEGMENEPDECLQLVKMAKKMGVQSCSSDPSLFIRKDPNFGICYISTCIWMIILTLGPRRCLNGSSIKYHNPVRKN